jgi:methyl-accepting chemotaxis protein
VEETAAAMEEFNSSVQHNAENATQGNILAQQASEIATTGGEVVGQVVATMRQISDSSRKIADIIGLIDEIAFQTNMLALNAAVEAARAGEEGRGFSVVASEVRSLAGRTAEAAKEIKALIGASLEHVEFGTAQADRAGNTMNEVVTAIRKVAVLGSQIADASREQARTVAQVGQAISELDRNTQQNASLVSESASSADALRQHATQLVNAVNAFRQRH